MTISLPKELHQKMKEFPQMKWSEIARNAIEERAGDLEEMNKIASKSRLTKKDVEELSKKIKKAAAGRFLP